MPESVKGCVYRRLTTAITLAGGLYLAKHYVQDRLDEMKSKLEQERAAQERYHALNRYSTRFYSVFFLVYNGDFNKPKKTYPIPF